MVLLIVVINEWTMLRHERVKCSDQNGRNDGDKFNEDLLHVVKTSKEERTMKGNGIVRNVSIAQIEKTLAHSFEIWSKRASCISAGGACEGCTPCAFVPHAAGDLPKPLQATKM